MQPQSSSPESTAPTKTGPEAGPTGSENAPGVPMSRSTPRLTGSLNPIKDKDWGYAQARHLLWRAGFGGTPAQIQTLVRWGPTKSVDHLLNFDQVEFEPVKSDTFDRDIMRPLNNEERGEIARARRTGDEEMVTRLRAMRQEAERKDRGQMRNLQHWWLKRMIETPRPLEEKMTLFWHGHFATSYRTIEDSYHMFMQNQLFRKHAVGSFATLLGEIIRDPAMIAYLDNNDSRKGRPNENLARELMELFSLGVGNYTERDIKEGARALTGYTYEDDRFVFQKNNHDTGVKQILGRRGAMDGEDFVKAILEQPACARYICRKLYRYFVIDFPSGDKPVDQTAQGVMTALESTFASSGFQIKPVLRRLFLSEHFYGPRLMNDQIKSPAELVVGLIRSTNAPARDLGVLNDAMGMMGQSLFFPPSVKGWDGGRSWINTATMYIRQNIACFMLTGRTPSGFDPLAKQETFDALPILDQMGVNPDSPKDEIAEGVLQFMLGETASHNREALVRLMNASGTSVTNDTLTRVFLLVTAMPEYQLC
ncbi:MAG: DUF1800 domain-containing protein [Phycisphaerales bacterium]|nr:DUF1800 domain-containing protein [Phycisphaerales bacterium]